MKPIWIFLLFILLGSGCTNVPRTVSNQSLAGRPPWAFPRNASEETIIAEMRSHLTGIAGVAPNEDVLAYILLAQPISLEQCGSVIEKYRLRGGEPGAMQILRSSGSTLGLEFPATVTSTASLLSYLDPILNSLPTHNPTGDTPIKDTTSTVMCGSFAAWSTPVELLRLWNDHAVAIRGIGIGGRSGMVTGLWLPIRPGDPLR